MEFRILGPVEVVDNGRMIVLGGPKQRALLAALLLEANRVVALDRLIDLLWGERPPPTAATTVHVYVSQLRRLVGRERLVTRKPGYVLKLGEDELDYARFRRLVSRGRAAEDPAERGALLREALSLWRGGVLADLAYESFVRDEADRLEEERLAAIEAWADAELALGHEGALVAELERLAAEHPLRERFHVQLMLALYRCGRQADALAAYRKARQTLTSELGLEPSAALQRLEREILNQDPALGAMVAEAPPDRHTPDQPHRDERKVVTVLYASLGGGDRSDPENVRPFLRRVTPLLRAELERYGAAVARLTGTVLLAVFGAPATHEDDAERAVRAGLAVCALVARERGETPAPRLRVGIETGSALVEHQDDREIVTGDVVDVAMRLQAAVPAEGILVGDATRRAVLDAISFRKDRSIRFGGGADAIRAWEPVRPLRPLGTRRLPAQTPFVGRRAELASLREEVDRVLVQRTARVVTLVGPPGIGKTRLVAELRASARDLQWLYGRSLSYGDGVPFFALRQVVRERLGVRDDDTAETARAKVERAVDVETQWLVPHLKLLVGLDSERTGDRREAFAAWRRYFEREAEAAPLALVLEDVHWADDGLLDFVEHLREWATAPLFVVCTGRSELLARRPAWQATRLEPLPNDAAAQLFDALLPNGLAPGTRAAAVRAVGGNPLFAEEYARALAAQPGDDEPAVPESVQALIGGRIDTLPLGEKELLQDAAVIGRVVSPRGVAAASSRSLPEVLERLDGLARKEFLTRERRGLDDEFVFSHVLVRDVAYERLPRAERAERHRRVGEWLRSLPGPVDDRVEHLAYHYASALELARAAGDQSDDLVAPTVEFLRLAGERAQRLHAHREAIEYFERALALIGDDGRALPILERLGRSLQVVGRRDAARHTFERALAAATGADAVQVARLHRLLAGSFVTDYRYRDAHASYDRAEAAVEPLRGVDRRREWIQSHIDRLTLLYWEQDEERMRPVLERARPLVQRSGTPAQRAEFLAAHYLVRLLGERYFASDETVAISRRFLAAREALGDPVDIARAKFNVGFVQLTRGDVDEAREPLEAALATAERTDNAALRCRAATYLAVLHRWRGDVEATRRFGALARDVASELRMPEYIGIARATMSAVALHDGELERAEADAEGALEGMRSSAFAYFPWEWLARLPLLRIALLRGDGREARSQARALLDRRQQPLGDALEAALAAPGRRSLERALELAEADHRLWPPPRV